MVYSKYFDTDSKLSIIINAVIKFFNIKNIVFIFFSLILSSQIFIGNYPLFTVILFGVASALSVPLLVVAVPSVIGMTICGMNSTGICEILGIFVIFTIITAIINIQGISKKYEVLLKLIISFTVTELLINFINSTLIINAITLIESFFMIIIFYMLFVNGINGIINFKNGYVYSSEEKVAMIVTFAMTLSILNGVSIFNVSLMNILLFILVLVYGWKSGVLTGLLAGFATGFLMTFVTDIDIITIIMLGFSGAISGVLSKFGKIAVLIGFAIGNLYIVFYASGISDITVRITELLISSTFLLLIPRRLETKLDSIFNKNNTLDEPYQNVLDVASDTKEKINAISEIFDELSKVDVLEDEDEKKELKKIIKRYILETIDIECIDCEEKKKCKNIERINLIVEHIITKYEQNDSIDEGIFNDLNCSKKSDLIKGIGEIYNNVKIVKVLKLKEAENSKKMSKKYKEISSILKTMSKNIKAAMSIKDERQTKIRNELKLAGYNVYEDEYKNKDGNLEYTFITDILTGIDKQKKEIIHAIEQVTQTKVLVKLILNSSKTEKSRIKVVSIPEYEVKNWIISNTKKDEDICGDSYMSCELVDKKHIVVLSDGAGCGIEAANSSKMVISTLEKLFKNGFEVSKTFDILNSVIKLRINDSEYATVDACIVDLNTGKLNLIKLGAAPTYILDKNKNVTKITSMNLPSGIIDEKEYFPITYNASDGAIVVQITDGVILDDEKNTTIINYLKNVDYRKNIKVIADEITKIAFANNDGTLKDDITVSVTKVFKNT